MSYYAEYRNHERNIKKQAKVAHERAEKRREESLRNSADSRHSLVIEGRQLKVLKVNIIHHT